MASDPTKSELFNLTVLDLPDQTELILNAKYQYLLGIMNKVPRAERIKHLTQIASSSVEKYRDINDAFLFGILAKETQTSNECFQLLHSIMQDQWDMLCSQARYFTFSKFLNMKSETKLRLLWLVDKLLALQARGAENLLIGLLRQVKGGDYSEEGCVLIQKLYLMFVTHKNWYIQQSQLIPFSIYSFLRVISGNFNDLALKKQLATFCSQVLLEKFKECAVIGRDLIRILQDVSRMTEFTPVWKFLYQKSSSQNDSSSFETSQIYKILQIPTPKKFLACRLTPEMEVNLLFILDHVKYGGSHHRKYYEWFASDYVKVSDPENLIIDIIRYLIVAYHPPNSVLASNSVQRWQIITWFLRQMKTNYSTANAKLALFYDWLFYDPAIDNIMNVEPAILIISKSATANPKISCTMIEFLYLLRKEYLPAIAEKMDKCIDKTMFDILSKRVISNLESILLSDQIGDDIKKQTKELFPCYANLLSLKSNFSLNQFETQNVDMSDAIRLVEKCFHENDLSNADTSIILFIKCLGTASDFEFENCEKKLINLIQDVLKNFSDEEDDERIREFANGFRRAFDSPSLDKDAVDRAIERISLLPLNDFNIETFLTISPKSSQSSLRNIQSSQFTLSNNSSTSLSASTSTTTSENIMTNDSMEDVVSYGVEDKLRYAKASDTKSFYGNCFTQFYLELSESPNVIELIGVILEDTDPSQLFSLKNQLLMGSRNPFNVNWNNLIKSLPMTRNWDGYCQIFLWDLLTICIKQISDSIGSFKELLQAIKPVLIEENSEICNGFLNVTMSFYPKNSQINDYFNWLLVFLEEGNESGMDIVNSVIMMILTFYWRMNSRFFLQSLVKLDEDDGPSSKKFDKTKVKQTLISFSKTISALDENSPAKKSLLSCLETTIALMSKNS